MTKQNEARYIGMWLEYNHIEAPDRLLQAVKVSKEEAETMFPYSFKDLKVKLTKIK